MRLIDVDELLKDKVSNAYVSRFEIENAPTIDAEPIVRCKECVHHNKEEVFYRSSNDSYSCKCEWFSSYQGITGGIYTSENDYCNYGAKMDEEVKK